MQLKDADGIANSVDFDQTAVVRLQYFFFFIFYIAIKQTPLQETLKDMLTQIKSGVWFLYVLEADQPKYTNVTHAISHTVRWNLTDFGLSGCQFS